MQCDKMFLFSLIKTLAAVPELAVIFLLTFKINGKTFIVVIRISVKQRGEAFVVYVSTVWRNSSAD